MRLCKSEPWVIAVLKRYGTMDFPQISAQIAAFLHKALGQRANTTHNTIVRTGLKPEEKHSLRFIFMGRRSRTKSRTPSPFGYSPNFVEGESERMFSPLRRRRGGVRRSREGVLAPRDSATYSLSLTPALANVAMPLWQFTAARTKPAARAAPDASPSRIPKSSKGFKPSFANNALCAGSADTWAA